MIENAIAKQVIKPQTETFAPQKTEFTKENRCDEAGAKTIETTTKKDVENNTANNIEEQAGRKDLSEAYDEGKVEHQEVRNSLPENQFPSIEKCQECYSDPDKKEKLILGEKKDGSMLRHNMSVAMGDDARNIDLKDSRAHHIVGDNLQSEPAKRVLERHDIDINAPENGVFLPNNENSSLKGTQHRGDHTKDYFEKVNDLLAQTKTKQEVLEVLQFVKEDLYEGKIPLHKEHLINK